MSSKLNIKQWVIASIAVFVGMSILEFILHVVILSSWYAAEAQHSWWRSEEEMSSLRGWMYLGYAFYALLFTLIYSKGYEGKPGLGEGLRYGFWVGLLVHLPKMFVLHAVYPYPGKILVTWMVGGLAESIILGAIVAMIYKGSQQTASA